MNLNFKIFALILALSSSAWGASALDYYQGGNSLYQKGQWQEAARYYQAAINMDPALWQAYSGLGNAEYRMGNNPEALAAYDKSLAIHPENPDLKIFADKLRPQTLPPLPQTNNAGTSSANGLPDLSGPLPTPSASGTGAPGEWKPQNKLATRSSLPAAGKFSFVLGTGGTLLNSQDLKDFYGPALILTGVDFGEDFYLGADYTVIPNFQLGARFQGYFKTPYQVDSAFETDTWSTFGLGGALVGRGVFSLTQNLNLVLFAQGEFCSLVGSHVDVETSSASGTVDLGGSGFGGTVGMEVEILQDPRGSFVLDLGAGYRFMTLSPITETYNGSSQTLLNASDGTNAHIDFSGVRFHGGVRFY